MKKFLTLVVFTAFFILPSISTARCVIITDNDLSTIFAKDGYVTTVLTDITMKPTSKVIFTDGWNYWDPNHNYGPSPHMKNAPWFFYGTPENNPQKDPGSGLFDQKGYLGLGSYTTGGLIERSGSVTVGYPDLLVSSTEPSRVTIFLNNISIDAHIGVDVELMIGQTPDSSKSMVLMHKYLSNFSIERINGSVTICAHN
ncbi:MAG TPA: hypothetical protein VMU29_07360 [Smithella sp.]|nr:hypothetical protein [Smithella sp.]